MGVLANSKQLMGLLATASTHGVLAVSEQPEGLLAVGEQPEDVLAIGELPLACLPAASGLLACSPSADLTDRGSIPHSHPLVMSSTLELTNGKAVDTQPPFHQPPPSQTDQAPQPRVGSR